jgi:catechol 2,3-dioxygenase-like lactoylglutathione lyase family enzyme
MDGQRLLGWPTWVGIVVADLPRERQFWADLLGVPEDHSGPDFVDFEMGGGRSFELIRRSDDPEYDRKRFQVGSRSTTSRPCVPNSFVEESNRSGTSSTTRPVAMGLFPRSGRERLRNQATASEGGSGKRRRRSSVRLSKIGWVGTRTENPEAMADFLRIR